MSAAGALLLLLAGACAKVDAPAADVPVPPYEAADTSYFIHDSLVHLNGLRPAMHRSEVRALLGDPLSIRAAAETTGRFSLESWRYADVTILFADGRLAGATCIDSCVLPRGIAIGWSRREVEATWEIPPVVLAANHPNSIMYPASLLHCGLVFDFFGGRLSSARIWCKHD